MNTVSSNCAAHADERGHKTRGGDGNTGSKPDITVVCHTFNHRQYIDDTLEGIFSQKCDFDFDVLINDDASPDGTGERIAELTRSRRNVRLIRHEENQFSKGRRPPSFTFRAVAARYIALCEGDDYWIDPGKLQKQVEALESMPDVDICVHPAMRLSMRTGKMKRSFYYGNRRRVIAPEVVIARHNQFAPTASFVMRTEAVQNMPDWFFDAPELPIGDFFIEAILGRKGVLYLPDVMSVYRRGVPDSYTDRFMHASGETLANSLERMLFFTRKLEALEGIPGDALEKRESYVRLNYALQYLAVGDEKRFRELTPRIRLPDIRGGETVLKLLGHNRLFFRLGGMGFRILQKYRS